MRLLEQTSRYRWILSDTDLTFPDIPDGDGRGAPKNKVAKFRLAPDGGTPVRLLR